MGPRTTPDAPARLPVVTKARIVLRIWSTYLGVRADVRSHAFPEVVGRLPSGGEALPVRVQPKRLGSIVERTLRVGPWRARCLFTSLVTYRLLSLQGEHPRLVIGLPLRPRDKDAHAWVEIDGVDVGPPPGGRGHQALARYP